MSPPETREARANGPHATNQITLADNDTTGGGALVQLEVLPRVFRASDAIVDGEYDFAHAILLHLEEDVEAELGRAA